MLPADHRVADGAAFRATLAGAARGGARPATGSSPWASCRAGRRPATATSSSARRCRVRRVCAGSSASSRSPTAPRPRASSPRGRHLWNAGIFVFRGETLLRRLRPTRAGARRRSRRDRPRAVARRRALRRAAVDLDRLRGDGEARRPRAPCRSTAAGATSAPGRRSPSCCRADARRQRRTRRRGGPRGARATCSSPPTAGRSPCSASRAWSSCAPATRCWSRPRERAQEVRRLVDELERAGRADLL